MAGNARVRTGRYNELRLDKERSGEKIDGVSALVMGITRVLAQPTAPQSPYDVPSESFDPQSVWI
jgi:hypothetical protein